MSAELIGDLKTVLEQAAFVPVDDQGFLRITGADATRWLNGMVTNSVQALEPGEGNYNFLLNAQGRIQGDCTIYRDPGGTQEPAYLLQTGTSQIDAIQQLLDRFIIMDDVELTPLEQFGQAVVVLGPTASEVLKKLARPLLAETDGKLGPSRTALFASTPDQIVTSLSGLVPHFQITTADQAQLSLLRSQLEAAGALEVGPESPEQLRILEARPRYGIDIRDKDLPQETNQTQALHFAKGCYVGQEIVERIRSRGQVHRLLTPFRLDGTAPAALPAVLQANGKPAGELTSVTTVETTEGPRQLAIGYARREFLETKTPLTYETGTAHPRQPGRLG